MVAILSSPGILYVCMSLFCAFNYIELTDSFLSDPPVENCATLLLGMCLHAFIPDPHLGCSIYCESCFFFFV